MRASMLEIQQYLDLHPVAKMNLQLKTKYINLLKQLIAETGSKDLWVESMIRLYSLKLCDDSQEDKGFSFYELFKNCFNYHYFRYFLLTDCLFITALNDRKKGDQVLKGVIQLYGERYKNKILSLFLAFYHTGNQTIIEKIPVLKPMYEVIWKNREFLGRTEKRIMVTANMSAGKSTLLNALSGKKVNKMQNTTCTAKIHYLHNKAGEDGLIYEWDHDLELDATEEILMEDNEANDSNEIHVGARFRSLWDVDTRVCFIDTPGVNSSMESDHKEMSHETIKTTKCDLLLYLFNGENIGSDDDMRHLSFVKENYNGNIIFLVNRMDRFKKGVDSVTETMKTVRKDLEKLGFPDPKVYPISAYAAYLAKMSMYGEKLNEDEQEELEFLKRKLSREEFAYPTYYPNEVDISDKKDNEFADVLVHSGILLLEDIIFN